MTLLIKYGRSHDFLDMTHGEVTVCYVQMRRLKDLRPTPLSPYVDYRAVDD